MASDDSALEFVHWIVDKAIQGVPPMGSAESLANEFLSDKSFANDSKRISALITWETSKNFASGFVTGLGGFATLPVAVPAALGASYVIQARMAGAIAVICGHDLREDRVKTFVLLSLLGDSANQVLKQAGVKIGNKLTEKVIGQVPGKVLIEINKKVGFRLITKAGEKGVVNLMKVVPVAGGVVSGAFDAAACQTVGNTAKTIFMKDSCEAV